MKTRSEALLAVSMLTIFLTLSIPVILLTPPFACGKEASSESHDSCDGPSAHTGLCPSAPAGLSEGRPGSQWLAIPAEDLAAPFRGTRGFIGGDGVYSLPLGPDRVLWLFGDSFIGRVMNGGRPGAAMVNNMVAVSGTDWSDPDLRFFWRTRQGRPRSFFEPSGNESWFWPLHGYMSPAGRLFIFLIEITRTGPADDVFAFGPAGNWLAVIDNPEKDPPLWRVEYRRIEFFDHAMAGRTGASEPMAEVWGNWVMQPPPGTVTAAGRVWVYGVSHPAADPGAKRMRAASVPADGFDRFAEWEMVDGDTGLEGPAMEISAFYLDGGKVLAVYPKGDMASHVWCALAPSPAGPFGAPWRAMELPPPLKKGQFAYAVKAHPWISLPKTAGVRPGHHGVLVTYIFNSFRFEDLIEDARVYTPKTAVLFER